jgi:hypothetical protein
MVLIVVVGLVLAVSGCSVDTGKTDAIDKRLSDLEATVKRQQETIDEQASVISGINPDDLLSRISSLEYLHPEAAYVSSGSLDSYVVVRAVAGDLLVIVEDCVKYMDGYKLKLKVGNPSSATYSDFAITGQWPKKKGLLFNLGKSPSTPGTRTQNYTSDLPGGSWTLIDFVVTPATEYDMKYVKLTFDTNTVSLKGGS